MGNRAPRERRTLDHSDSIPLRHESCVHDCSARGPCWTYLSSAQDHQASRPRHGATCSRYCQAGEDVHPLCYALAAGPSMPYLGQARDAQLCRVCSRNRSLIVIRRKKRSQPFLASSSSEGHRVFYTAAVPLRALLSGYTNTGARQFLTRTGGLKRVPWSSWRTWPVTVSVLLAGAVAVPAGSQTRFRPSSHRPGPRCHMVQAVVSGHMATGD